MFMLQRLVTFLFNITCPIFVGSSSGGQVKNKKVTIFIGIRSDVLKCFIGVGSVCNLFFKVDSRCEKNEVYKNVF